MRQSKKKFTGITKAQVRDLEPGPRLGKTRRKFKGKNMITGMPEYDIVPVMVYDPQTGKKVQALRRDREPAATIAKTGNGRDRISKRRKGD